ncbi:ferritin-like domain-containing protein [Thalassoglobus sp. JC818]|uniref:YciE/YciF ferroxidase family protein n=1 Tax=Thalassoglobus sp. JC818 TaxID=3232136 RepID=UPI00345B150B
MKLDSLMKLYVHELKDLFSAENQLVDALPKMVKAANDEDLKTAFKEHLTETEKQIQRLEKIFAQLEFEPGGHKCAGMEGLITEGEHLMKSEISPNVLDAALIAAAQRVEHYEMAGYGTARTYAEKLGRHEDADLLQETLNEEGHADQLLSRLAERRINFLAMNK